MTLNTDVLRDQNQNKYDHVNMKTVDSYIDEVEKLIEELISKITQLPEVDASGYSECPFAEDLYAYAETAAKNLEEALKILLQYISAVEKETERCRHNLQKISSDRQKLHDDEAQKNYDHAKKAQLSEYNQAILRRKRLFEIIQKADEELKKAKEKKWPLGEPEEQIRFNPGVVNEGAINEQHPDMPPQEFGKDVPITPSFEKEINSLISMGPIGGNSFYK